MKFLRFLLLLCLWVALPPGLGILGKKYFQILVASAILCAVLAVFIGLNQGMNQLEYALYLFQSEPRFLAESSALKDELRIEALLVAAVLWWGMGLIR